MLNVVRNIANVAMLHYTRLECNIPVRSFLGYIKYVVCNNNVIGLAVHTIYIAPVSVVISADYMLKSCNMTKDTLFD